MNTTRTLAATALAMVTMLAAPAAAQFDPLHNHLHCYRIKGKPVRRAVALDDQFGTHTEVVLTPVLLCLPTVKTVLDDAQRPDPQPVASTPVHHFKCYKVKTRERTKVPVLLTDQFGQEPVVVGPAQLLCTPVVKEHPGSTTTTTTTTSTTYPPTTTTQPDAPCNLTDTGGTAPFCSGLCPNGKLCLFIAPGASPCECVAAPLGCGDQGGQCGGHCTGPQQQCVGVPGVGCRCVE